jgi:hypothetical protein
VKTFVSTADFRVILSPCRVRSKNRIYHRRTAWPVAGLSLGEKSGRKFGTRLSIVLRDAERIGRVFETER